MAQWGFASPIRVSEAFVEAYEKEYEWGIRIRRGTGDGSTDSVNPKDGAADGIADSITRKDGVADGMTDSVGPKDGIADSVGSKDGIADSITDSGIADVEIPDGLEVAPDIRFKASAIRHWKEAMSDPDTHLPASCERCLRCFLFWAHGVSDGCPDCTAAEGGGDAEAGGGGGDAAPGAAGFQPRDADGSRDASAAAARAGDVAAARMVMYTESIQHGDDALMRRLRSQMRNDDRGEKDARTEVGVFLKQRAEAVRSEDAKRRRLEREKEKADAIYLEDRKTARANAEKAASEARLQALRQASQNRRDLETRRRADLLEREHQRWLQVTFPVLVAQHCIDLTQKMKKGAFTFWQQDIQKLLADNVFERHVTVPHLWDSTPSFTVEWAQVLPFTGGPKRGVRCGLPFQTLLEKYVPQEQCAAKDPIQTLLRLLSLCVPKARDIFTGASHPARMLHMNAYVMEKTFLYGIICLSKWVGQEKFPTGIYGQWPPPLPDDCKPNIPPAAVVDLQ